MPIETSFRPSCRFALTDSILLAWLPVCRNHKKIIVYFFQGPAIHPALAIALRHLRKVNNIRP